MAACQSSRACADLYSGMHLLDHISKDSISTKVRVWNTPPDMQPHLCSVQKAQAATWQLQGPKIHWGTVVFPGHKSQGIRLRALDEQ